MRIAFLTPEYVSELPDGGGLGMYVHRIAKSLLEAGHEPEVFVSRCRETNTTSYQNVTVHKVNAARDCRVLNFLRGGSSRVLRFDAWRCSAQLVMEAIALAAALERRHADSPFQLVQSADWLATGLCVRRRPGRLHAVRCSSATDLYSEFDRESSLTNSWRGYLERLSMQRADIVYAPSRYLADYFRRVHKIDVRVIRPPIFLASSRFPPLPFSLPARFFLHFGQLIERKGTALLAQALPIAWTMAPDLTMVWSGYCGNKEKLEGWRSLWGEHVHQVQITGPLTRENLYAVIKRADAAVLPSQVDNLPNTVIESLMFGIPVLGSRGASIDELVDEGQNGHLVAIGDVNGLAEALAKMWLNKSPVRKGFVWNTIIAQEMQAERAIANLIALVDAPS